LPSPAKALGAGRAQAKGVTDTIVGYQRSAGMPIKEVHQVPFTETLP